MVRGRVPPRERFPSPSPAPVREFAVSIPADAGFCGNRYRVALFVLFLVVFAYGIGRLSDTREESSKTPVSIEGGSPQQRVVFKRGGPPVAASKIDTLILEEGEAKKEMVSIEKETRRRKSLQLSVSELEKHHKESEEAAEKMKRYDEEEKKRKDAKAKEEEESRRAAEEKAREEDRLKAEKEKKAEEPKKVESSEAEAVFDPDLDLVRFVGRSYRLCPNLPSLPPSLSHLACTLQPPLNFLPPPGTPCGSKLPQGKVF